MRILFGIILIALGLLFGLFSCILFIVSMSEIWTVYSEDTQSATLSLGEAGAIVLLLILSGLLARSALRSGVRRIQHEKEHNVEALDDDLIE